MRTRPRLVLTVVVACGLLGACSSGGAKSSATSAPAVTVSAGAGWHAVVGRRALTLVDPSRPTPAVDGHERLPQRTMPTVVYYPARVRDAGGAHVVDDAAPIPGRSLPLIVFAPGIGSTPDSYRSHLVSWAAAGYVVAGFAAPVANVAHGTGDDYRNEPEDVGFVITSMLGRPDPLRAEVDASEVAVAGHSIGAQTVLGHVFNSCCGDRRVGAVVAISGSELPYGGDWSNPPKTPLLLIHGEQDHTVGFASSQAIFDTFTGPRALLAYPAASHSTQLVDASGVLLDAAVVAFLDHTLRHRDAAWIALPAKVSASGLATLATRG